MTQNGGPRARPKFDNFVDKFDNLTQFDTGPRARPKFDTLSPPLRPTIADDDYLKSILRDGAGHRVGIPLRRPLSRLTARQ